MNFDKALEELVGFIWGMPLVFFIIGAGVVLTIRSRGLPYLKLGYVIRILREKPKESQPGIITHFRALATSLSGIIGLGNISGVALAIVTGGPGAMFWMWLLGILGMCVRYFTCTLTVTYRKQLKNGEISGGTMQVIEQGMGKKWRFLAVLFSIFVVVASFGGGTMFQSNQMSVAINYYYRIPKYCCGIVIAIAVAFVILGGIRKISNVASKIVPFMCGLYLLGAIVILTKHITEIPSVIMLIFRDAFTGDAVAGGALGTVVIQGVRRGVFSSEIGLGSAPIAHAAVKTDQPIRQGLVAMLDPLIDTLVICTITALVVTISGIYTDSDLISQASKNSDLKGIIVATEAFNQSIPWFGKYVVSIAAIFFAFTSMITWSYCGEQGCRYLFGEKAIKPYQAIFVVAVFLGAIWKLGPVLNFSDAMFGLMAVPTLLSTVILSNRVIKMTKEYFGVKQQDHNNAIETQ